MKEILQAITERLTSAGINYVTGRKRGDITYPYFVGQLYYIGAADESGKQEYELLLDGFIRGADETPLYDAVETIAEAFPGVGGYTIATKNGLMSAWYKNLIPDIPDMADVSRNQITIGINYWKGGK